MTIADLYVLAKPHLSQLETFVAETGLIGSATADHIGYKCGSTESFEQWRAMLEVESRFVYQSIISGRRIAIVGLVTPFMTSLGDIQYLVLADQKPDGSQREGFDHVELLPKHAHYDDFIDVLRADGVPFVANEKAHHTTYDVPITRAFKVKFTREALLPKIQRNEMV